jgi:predicted secreted protein
MCVLCYVVLQKLLPLSSKHSDFCAEDRGSVANHLPGCVLSQPRRPHSKSTCAVVTSKLAFIMELYMLHLRAFCAVGFVGFKNRFFGQMCKIRKPVFKI